MNDAVCFFYALAIFFGSIYLFGSFLLNIVVFPILGSVYWLTQVPWPFYAAAIVGLISVAALHK